MKRSVVLLLSILLLLSVLACGLADATIGHTECYWARSCCTVPDGTGDPGGYCRTIAGDGSLCGPCPPGTLPQGECVVTCVHVTSHP